MHKERVFVITLQSDRYAIFFMHKVSMCKFYSLGNLLCHYLFVSGVPIQTAGIEALIFLHVFM